MLYLISGRVSELSIERGCTAPERLILIRTGGGQEMKKSIKNALVATMFLAGTAHASPAHAETTLSSIASSIFGAVKNIPSSISSFFNGFTSSSNQNARSIPRAPAHLDAARFAIANSTNADGEAARTAAFSDANCKDILVTAQEARVEAVQRYTPPSPVNVIRDSTCFVDVIGIKIPHTGIGYLDQLLPQIIKMASDSACNSTNGFWSKISNSVKTGSVADLLGSAINAGTTYVAQEFQQMTPPSYVQTPTIGPISQPLTIQSNAPKVVAPPGGWGLKSEPALMTRTDLESEIGRMKPLLSDLASLSLAADASLRSCVTRDGRVEDGNCQQEFADLKAKANSADTAKQEIDRLQATLRNLPAQ